VPLKDDVGLKTWLSPALSLVSSGSVLVGVPSIDSVIRSIQLVAVTATTGAIAVNVGTAATAAYYATVTAGTRAQDNVADLTLLRTDLRAGTPMRLATPGGGTGSVAIMVEYE